MNSKTNEVFNLLKNRINAGYYITSGKLPPVRNLSKDLGYSINTINNALLKLQAESLVSIIPRSGVYINSNEKISVEKTTSIIKSMVEKKSNFIIDFLEPTTIINSDEFLSNKFKVKKNTSLIKRFSLHFLNKKPYRIQKEYYLASLFEKVLMNNSHYIPLYDWLSESKGINPDEVCEKINIRVPSDYEAEKLEISKSVFVIEIDRLVWGDDRTLFEYTKIIANSSLHELKYKYKI